MELFDPQGHRLYLIANNAQREVRTFCLVRSSTGCRISEALALTPTSFDFSGRAIVFETIKKAPRRGLPDRSDAAGYSGYHRHGARAPGQRKTQEEGEGRDSLMAMVAHNRFPEGQGGDGRGRNRRHGPQKYPKGLRHGYGVHAIGSGVPLNMLSKWMGHASLEVIAIYANAQGEAQHKHRSADIDVAVTPQRCVIKEVMYY
jgi:integrase/recombinase XerD